MSTIEEQEQKAIASACEFQSCVQCARAFQEVYRNRPQGARALTRPAPHTGYYVSVNSLSFDRPLDQKDVEKYDEDTRLGYCWLYVGTTTEDVREALVTFNKALGRTGTPATIPEPTLTDETARIWAELEAILKLVNQPLGFDPMARLVMGKTPMLNTLAMDKGSLVSSPTQLYPDPTALDGWKYKSLSRMGAGLSSVTWDRLSGREQYTVLKAFAALSYLLDPQTYGLFTGMEFHHFRGPGGEALLQAHFKDGSRGDITVRENSEEPNTRVEGFPAATWRGLEVTLRLLAEMYDRWELYPWATDGQRRAYKDVSPTWSATHLGLWSIVDGLLKGANLNIPKGFEGALEGIDLDDVFVMLGLAYLFKVNKPDDIVLLPVDVDAKVLVMSPSINIRIGRQHTRPGSFWWDVPGTVMGLGDTRRSAFVAFLGELGRALNLDQRAEVVAVLRSTPWEHNEPLWLTPAATTRFDLDLNEFIQTITRRAETWLSTSRAGNLFIDRNGDSIIKLPVVEAWMNAANPSYVRTKTSSTRSFEYAKVLVYDKMQAGSMFFLDTDGFKVEPFFVPPFPRKPFSLSDLPRILPSDPVMLDSTPHTKPNPWFEAWDKVSATRLWEDEVRGLKESLSSQTESRLRLERRFEDLQAKVAEALGCSANQEDILEAIQDWKATVETANAERQEMAKTNSEPLQAFRDAPMLKASLDAARRRGDDMRQLAVDRGNLLNDVREELSKVVPMQPLTDKMAEAVTTRVLHLEQENVLLAADLRQSQLLVDNARVLLGGPTPG